MKKHVFWLVAAAAVVGLSTPAASQAPDIIVVHSDPPSGLNLADLAPGDTTEWSVQVNNVASKPVPVTMLFTTSETDPGSVLTTDPVHGLQAEIELCTVPWEPEVAGPVDATVFTCSDATSRILTAPVADVIDVPFQATHELGAGGSLHVRTTILFPFEAGNEFENLAGSVKIEFVAELTEDIPGTTLPPPDTVPDPSDPPGPTVPGQPGDPGTPPQPSDPGQPDPPGWRPPLPRTGSDVLGLVAVGVAFFVVGSALRSAAKRRGSPEVPAETSADTTSEVTAEKVVPEP